MGKLPANMERDMSDVALAKNIITEIAGNAMNGKGDMLERVYKACEPGREGAGARSRIHPAPVARLLAQGSSWRPVL